MKTAFPITLLLAAMVTAAFAQDGPRYSHTGPTMITGVRVIDGLGGAPQENQDVVVIDGKIARIEAAGRHDAPKGARVINGKGMTAMPVTFSASHPQNH